MTNYTGSVWVDNEPVLAGVPLQADLGVESPPELSLTRDGSVPVDLWIDDVGVEVLDLSLLGRDAADVAFRPLFRDNFNRYESALFPRQGGWSAFPAGTSAGEKVGGEVAEEGAKMLRAAREEEEAASSVDDRIYASSARSFKLEGTDEEPGRATKRFSLPEKVPYCVSAEPFAIMVPGEAGQTESKAISSRDREMESRRQKRWDFEKEGRTQRPAGRSGPASSKPAASPVRSGSSEGMEEAKLMSGVPVSGTFYIYAFDGRLLAEYDVAGALVRDYIHFGGQLVAEYTGTQLFYYASDQINSTRIVTDSSGTVVYAAAHEPYGGIQKTWVTTYDPALKFSGKQRDAESDLDYFGARYYARAQFRFLSVDPITTQSGYVIDPHSWNLYAYCGNNPLVNIDQTGRWKSSVHYHVTYEAMLMAFDGWNSNFAAGLAHIVASACAGVDSSPSTTSTPWITFAWNGTSIVPWIEFPDLRQRQAWHFPTSEDLASAYDIAGSTLDPIAFGMALHVIQDSFSHGAYVESASHLFETLVSIFGLPNPDNPLDFWDPALAMAYITLDLCYAYEQRLREFFGERF